MFSCLTVRVGTFLHLLHNTCVQFVCQSSARSEGAVAAPSQDAIGFEWIWLSNQYQKGMVALVWTKPKDLRVASARWKLQKWWNIELGKNVWRTPWRKNKRNTKTSWNPKHFRNYETSNYVKTRGPHHDEQSARFPHQQSPRGATCSGAFRLVFKVVSFPCRDTLPL